jgi:hypothetical protein
MTVVVGVKREYEFTANDLNSDPCIFPRHPVNHVFVQAFGFATKQIAEQDGQYLAFPYAIKIGASLIGIYSDGDAHASSDKQVMIRSDDGGLSWDSVDFYVAAVGSFDFSLLTDLLSPGQTAVFKVWTVKNTAGVFSATANPAVVYGGLTYALWSRAVDGPSGKLYRTGYATNGADTQTALFESSDGGTTWTGKAVMFSGAGKLYNEADLVNTSGSNWLAFVREDSGASNPIYSATSADDGATWSAPTLLTVTSINGRQPNLTKLSDGSIILATGDRSGGSGYGGSAGDQVAGFDTTGITVFRSTDNGSTWSFRTRLAPISSTDGGQPMVVETTAGRICCVYYGRKSTKTQPVIASALLDVANL